MGVMLKNKLLQEVIKKLWSGLRGKAVNFAGCSGTVYKKGNHVKPEVTHFRTIRYIAQASALSASHIIYPNVMNDTKAINNNFHKHLADTAAQKSFVKVHYYSDIHELLKVTSVVKGLENRNGQEYLLLASGEEIPTNQLLRVGDQIAPGHDTDDAYSCSC